MRRFSIIGWVIGVGLSSLTGIVFGQEFTFENGIKKNAMSFKLVRNLIVIPIFINDKGPFNFILDTGVGPMVITDTDLVDSLEIKNMVPYKLVGAGAGADFETFVTNEISAQVGDASITHIPTVLIVNAPFDLSSYVGIPIQGILGHYFFKSFLVKVNYAWKRLVFYSPESSKKPRGERIPIKLINNKPYITTDIRIEGSDTTSLSIRLLLDTGASHAVSLETMDEQPFLLPSKTIPASLGIGLGGPISGKIGRINQLDIGGFSLDHVVVSFPDYEDIAAKVNTPDRNGTLGGELLKRFSVFIDYADEAIYLKRNRFYNAPFENDMSGLEVYLEFGSYNRFFIGRVEEDSPGEEAGFLIHDEIISINFNLVKHGSLDDILHILKSGKEKSIIIEVIRNNVHLFKVLHLKSRI